MFGSHKTTANFLVR